MSEEPIRVTKVHHYGGGDFDEFVVAETTAEEMLAEARGSQEVPYTPYFLDTFENETNREITVVFRFERYQYGEWITCEDPRIGHALA